MVLRDVAPGAVAVMGAIGPNIGLTLAEMCEGTASPLDAQSGGMDWRSFCVVLDRVVDRCGSPEALAVQGALAMQVPELGAAIGVLRMVAGLEGLYWANFRWGGPSLFRMVQTSFMVRPDGRYVGTILLPPTHEHSEPFFHLCAGVFSALPRALGLADAVVDVTVTPQLGTYLITPPAASLSWFARLRLGVRAMTHTRELVDQLALQNEQLRAEARRASAARSDAEAAREVAEQRRVDAENSRRIAERDREEAILARQQAETALAARSRFIGVISHELRTPLNAVLGMNHLLSETRLDAEQREYVETIHASGRGLLTLINDILDFAKQDADRLTLEPRPTDLRELFASVARAAAARFPERAVTVGVRVAEGFPSRVRVDDHRLRQVVTNLMDNAVKFTEAGEVTLTIAYSGRVRVTIDDTGPGIPAELHVKIFEPFVQADDSIGRKHGGTGLGLAISARLVRLMGGELVLESRPTGGCRFWFEIDAPRLDIAPSEAKCAPSRVRVLAPRSVEGRILSRLVSTAGDRVVEDQPDAILFAWDGGDDSEVTCLANAWPGARRVVISDSGDEERARALGAHATLARPVSLEALRGVLHAATAPSPASAAAP